MTFRPWILAATTLLVVAAGFAWRRRTQAPAVPPPRLPTACAVCGGGVVPAHTIADDPTRPSRNLAVWNRSACGNALVLEMLLCPACWFAYQPWEAAWERSVEDPSAFDRPIDPVVLAFPAPPLYARRILFEQRFAGSWTHGVWVELDRVSHREGAGVAHAEAHGMEIERVSYPDGRLIQRARRAVAPP